MLRADRRERASCFGDRATAFEEKLKELETRLGFEHVTIELAPSLPHGKIAYKGDSGNGKYVQFDGGFDAFKYVACSEAERRKFFVDLAAAAAFWLCENNNIDSSKVIEAKRFAEDQISI